ncbi:SCY1-like protein 2 [Bicyclus anynana]|uniref:SCY1-like protein 2 n=1 Tax=Bicyclus anynana TaxID=110368 RepID=A0ABM3M6U8_BICAN|nr:SCY1-like protein 2 [Bicyclus anynana]
MSAIISKLTNATSKSPSLLENNPIMQYFEVIKESSCAGPDLIWRIYDAFRKSDGKECSVFVFDKRIADKLYKPKRNQSMLERIKTSINILDQLRHPRMLQIIHSLEEGQHSLAFASEAVFASLHNILAWHESSPIPPGGYLPVSPHPISLGPPTVQPLQQHTTTHRPPYAQEYHFLDMEIRFGLIQIIEALNYMHYTSNQIHRNVCPQIIIVTKRGTWKLFGLEFAENIIGRDPLECVSVPPWSIKVAKITQPNLDFLAPESQMIGQCNILSDMFSFGLVVCTLFNHGKQLIQANNNPMLYSRQIEFLEQQVNAVLPRIPAGLQEAVQRMLSRDPHPRPTTQLLPLINFFKCQTEPAIQAMQFLDVITLKDPVSKSNFYRGALLEALPFIPKKLRWQHVWPILHLEVKAGEVLDDVLMPIVWLTNESTTEEFETHVLPTLKMIDFRHLMSSPKTVDAPFVLFENLHVIMQKCPRDEFNKHMLPLLYFALDNQINTIQTASLIAVQNVAEQLSDAVLHNIVLGKVRILLEKHSNDVKKISLVLGFYEKVMIRLEKKQILEEVLPSLLLMRLTDPDITARVVRLYRCILVDEKCGLINVMATRMIPSLAPQTVNPALTVDQFGSLMEILYHMLDNIDQYQRPKLKQDPPKHSPERRGLRHQMSTDNIPAPPFNIPNLRVEKRKTSSAEDMARKNSVTVPQTSTSNTGSVASGFRNLGQWFFGSNTSATNEGNQFLQVNQVYPNRRLSDNTMLAPKIKIAPSCASSPGGTPGGASGLPTRRHSSIGPQERRSSAVNLSPPTGGSMPNTSSSVPFLLTSSMQSIRSRRTSAGFSGSHGSGILQQLSSGMHQLLSGRT